MSAHIQHHFDDDAVPTYYCTVACQWIHKYIHMYRKCLALRYLGSASQSKKRVGIVPLLNPHGPDEASGKSAPRFYDRRTNKRRDTPIPTPSGWLVSYFQLCFLTFFAWWRPPAQLMTTSDCLLFSRIAPPIEPDVYSWQNSNSPSNTGQSSPTLKRCSWV